MFSRIWLNDEIVNSMKKIKLQEKKNLHIFEIAFIIRNIFTERLLDLYVLRLFLY